MIPVQVITYSLYKLKREKMYLRRFAPSDDSNQTAQMYIGDVSGDDLYKSDDDLYKSGDDLYKLLAFYQILYNITLCDVYM